MNTPPHMLPLEKVAEVIPGVATRTPPAQGGARNQRVLTVWALTEHGIDAGDIAELDVLGKIADNQRLQPGDVLLPARSTRVMAVVVPPALAGIPINATLVAVRCGPQLNPQILAAYFNHPAGQLAIQSAAQSGTAQINLTAAALRQLPVPVPPPDQQACLAEMLSAADEAYTAAIQAAETRLRLARNLAVICPALPHRPRPSFSSSSSRQSPDRIPITTTTDDHEYEPRPLRTRPSSSFSSSPQSPGGNPSTSTRSENDDECRNINLPAAVIYPATGKA
jgi:hypothetical protein